MHKPIIFKPVLAMVLLIAIATQACKKSTQNTKPDLSDPTTINAMVHYTGPVAADGC